MLFHPIINRLANIDLTYLVNPADEQHFQGQTACFCPFCEKKFQFHKGTIETAQMCSRGNTSCHFNSIKVRLKPYCL